MNTGTMIVTGGGRGIGAAVARLAAARGYAVAVNYVSDAAAARQVVADIRAAGGVANRPPGGRLTRNGRGPAVRGDGSRTGKIVSARQ